MFQTKIKTTIKQLLSGRSGYLLAFFACFSLVATAL
ncbi:MAG: hypothetical protein RLZZ379_18, partial [Pseudomonadota bacterium]